MPKTTKKFDWEVYEGDEFIDVLSMSRTEALEYRIAHPEYTISEVGYTDDGNDYTREIASKKRRNVYSVRVPRR